MATRSRSQTPSTTPLSLEGEVEEMGFSPRQDDPHSLEESASLFPIADILDDTEDIPQNIESHNYGEVLPSLPRITPNVQMMLGKRYLPSHHQTTNFSQTNPRSPRRNPLRLARPTSPFCIPQQRRRSKSPSQEIPMHKL